MQREAAAFEVAGADPALPESGIRDPIIASLAPVGKYPSHLGERSAKRSVRLALPRGVACCP